MCNTLKCNIFKAIPFFSHNIATVHREPRTAKIRNSSNTVNTEAPAVSRSASTRTNMRSLPISDNSPSSRRSIHKGSASSNSRATLLAMNLVDPERVVSLAVHEALELWAAAYRPINMSARIRLTAQCLRCEWANSSTRWVIITAMATECPAVVDRICSRSKWI